MPLAKLRSKAQVTIPKAVIKTLNLSEGDLLDVAIENQTIVMTPKNLSDKALAVKLTAGEQKVLIRAKAKIDKINKDILNSKGLSRIEIDVAAKTGLIDPGQVYFWTEEWQKDIRAAGKEKHAGHVSPVFDNAEDAVAFLHKDAAEK